MARNRGSGIGCGCALLVAVILVLLIAWFAGAFDRLAYLAHLEAQHRQTEPLVQQTASEPAASESDAASGNTREGVHNAYAYSQLSADNKEKYLILLDSFKTREPRVFPETSMEDLAWLRDCILADHPELFYIGGVQTQTTSGMGGLGVTSFTVEGQYLFSQEDIEAFQPRIQAAMEECLAGLPEGAGDYAKAKRAYEYLASTVEYDRTSADSAGEVNDTGGSAGQTIADSLVLRNSLCAGYARGFQYFMQQMGISCVYVTGIARGESHAWCLAYLDGGWYQIDPTWGDPQFLVESDATVPEGMINYDYLCVTDADMAATHTPDNTFPLPACTSMADNYYVYEGLFVSEPDVDIAGGIISGVEQRGETQARFRCADRGIFDAVVGALFEGQQIYRYFSGTSCVYFLNEDMCTVEIVL